MAVTNVANAETVVPGKWICGEPIIRDAICNPPREVLRVSGQRVYFDGRHNDEAFRMMKTIKFVCDTEDEGKKMLAISDAQKAALSNVQKIHEEMVLAAIKAA